MRRCQAAGLGVAMKIRRIQSRTWPEAGGEFEEATFMLAATSGGRTARAEEGGGGLGLGRRGRIEQCSMQKRALARCSSRDEAGVRCS